MVSGLAFATIADLVLCEWDLWVCWIVLWLVFVARLDQWL